MGLYGVMFGKIRTQLITFYGLLILFTMLASGLVYQQINRNLAVGKLGDLSTQTASAIQYSLDSFFDNINKYSKRLIASSTVQEILQMELRESNIAQANKRLQDVVNEILIAEPAIASVFLLREDGVRFSWENRKANLDVVRPRDAPWYAEVVRQDGGLIWRLNAGGVMRPKGAGEAYLSLIRMVNELASARPIGVLIINVPLDEVRRSYNHIAREDVLDIMVWNPEETLVRFREPALADFVGSTEFQSYSMSTFVKSLGGIDYLFTRTGSELWQYAIAMPMNDLTNPYGPVNRTLLPIAALAFALIFLGSLWISRSITIPLGELLDSMRKVQSGHFAKVRFKSFSEEMRLLRYRYNSMISTIGQSIRHEMESQKLQRKLELDILQQQIKPHFLYNSLESAGYLTLSGEKDKAYRLINALANYYRFSLSKGSEVVDLAREFELVRNYLVIQDMRYPEMFHAEYALEEGLEACQVPKLVVQPLVENALYHGIRPMGQAGTIQITARSLEGKVALTVADDGMGLPQDQLDRIVADRLEANADSFGLRGTVERMRLFFGGELEYRVASAPNHGTLITFLFPKETAASGTPVEEREWIPRQ